jgi:hypothetical protein
MQKDFCQFPIKILDGLDPNGLMLVNQRPDGVEVATPDAHRFFSWEEINEMARPYFKRSVASGS